MGDKLTPRIAIIGAGATGISCAHSLQARGHQPVIFEKSRGLGGRLATRRTPDGDIFDHGAQYVTARSPAFRHLLHEAIQSGAAGHWRPALRDAPSSAEDDWIVGTPAMNALIKPFALDLVIRYGTEISAIERSTSGWQLRDSDHRAELFDILISTLPAPQAGRLFAGIPLIAPAIEQVKVAPCWALMIAFQNPIDLGFDVQLSDTDDLAWIARDSSKPDRNAARDCWVVHASAAWSERHLELDREQAAGKLIEMLQRAFGCQLPDIAYAAAHRWRFARTITPLGKPYICNEDSTLYVGGDWCLGARVECAFDSGRAIAEALPF